MEGDKTITISRNEYREIATDIAAEMCAKFGKPEYIIFIAKMLSETENRLFDNIVIGEEEGEQNG